MNEELNLIGLVKLTTAATPPENYAFCNGQTLEIDSDTTLFAVIGNSYGGNGRTNFQLPKLAPINGAQYIICTQGIFPARG